MTVAELIAELQKMPQERQVVSTFSCSRLSWFIRGPLVMQVYKGNRRSGRAGPGGGPSCLGRRGLVAADAAESLGMLRMGAR